MAVWVAGEDQSIESKKTTRDRQGRTGIRCGTFPCAVAAIASSSLFAWDAPRARPSQGRAGAVEGRKRARPEGRRGERVGQTRLPVAECDLICARRGWAWSGPWRAQRSESISSA